MANNYPSLADDIKALGIPRKDLSYLTGISYGSISHWINGYSNLTEGNMRRISDAIMVYKGQMSKSAFEKKYNRLNNLTM